MIEIFGTKPFSPEQKEERVTYTDKQREIDVYERSEKSQLINHYIHGEERSFTIIAYPVPSIGEKYEEIFAETVHINTLDYMLYRNMQQKIIDVLDTADRVHIKGCNGNRTDLYVKIHPLSDPAKETAFENCVADVNIPVGEVSHLRYCRKQKESCTSHRSIWGNSFSRIWNWILKTEELQHIPVQILILRMKTTSI